MQVARLGGIEVGLFVVVESKNKGLLPSGHQVAAMGQGDRVAEGQAHAGQAGHMHLNGHQIIHPGGPLEVTGCS